MGLVASYIRMHPQPFLVSLAGALLFAFASIGLTTEIGRATDEVRKPAFGGGVPASKIWIAALLLMLGGTCRAPGMLIRPSVGGVGCDRVLATLPRHGA